MKIAVTGTTGFIGNHLCTWLWDQGHTIDKWDRRIGPERDINNFKLEQDVDFVIHLAADADVRRSIEEPQEYWDNNVEPTTRIQSICHLRNVPLLYASSSCIHEWHKSPYGMSKKVNEETAFPGQVGLRFTTVYGDGARDSMFVGKLLRHELKFATDHIRDFIHVSDVIQAIELIMLKITDSHLFPETALRPAYDIGTGNGYAVSNVAKMLFPEVPIQTGDECEAQDNTADLTAINELGFKAKVDVLEYIAKNGKRYLYDFEL